MKALVWFIIVITPIVFIHELGHFLFARLFGVGVNVFSIGFGKPLLKWRDSKGTIWQIAMIPLGGYVKMYGDEGIASTPDKNKLENLSEEEKQLSFYHKKLWQKALIVFGGPFANYLLTIVLFIFLSLHSGIIEYKPEVTQVQKNSAAQKAGIKAGDIIVDFNGQEINSVKDFKSAMALCVNDEVRIGYISDDTYLHKNIILDTIDVKDITGTINKQRFLGVVFEKYIYKKVNFFESVTHSIQQSIDISYVLLKSVWQMLTGQRSTDDLGGPIKIARYSAEIANHGFLAMLSLIAMISLNLGLINLLPIPMLDGGHLFFYAVETIIRRPISHRIQVLAFKIGLVFLISLMVFAFWNDLKGIEIVNKLKQIILHYL